MSSGEAMKALREVETEYRASDDYSENPNVAALRRSAINTIEKLFKLPSKNSLLQLVYQIIVRSQADIGFTQFTPSTIVATSVLIVSLELFPMEAENFNRVISSSKFIRKDEVLRCMNDMQNKFKGDKALTLSISRWSGEDIPFMNFELHWTNDPQPKEFSEGVFSSGLAPSSQKKRGRPVGSKSKSDIRRGQIPRRIGSKLVNEVSSSSGTTMRVGSKRPSSVDDNRSSACDGDEVWSPAKKPRLGGGNSEASQDSVMDKALATDTVEEASQNWPQGAK
ncbi:hypothetical protein RHGRI_023660 [Rhododendron griersonianum]|uniref:Cyclin N-terminal domain-containing protein n=1 Tax=Rhododendron griersonianum TaxID=479676 RepID=A0AAV6J7M9_9ERIC|nr:hypothetical protein RHGRI_023660 [Rhododendron griersonianum]